jgi:hypothetical protein
MQQFRTIMPRHQSILTPKVGTRLQIEEERLSATCREFFEVLPGGI